jgi:hypothetical protein
MARADLGQFSEVKKVNHLILVSNWEPYPNCCSSLVEELLEKLSQNPPSKSYPIRLYLPEPSLLVAYPVGSKKTE